MQTQNTTPETKLPAGLTLRVPDEARVLIVSDDDSETERLKTAFRKAGMDSESTNNMAEGCESANPVAFK